MSDERGYGVAAGLDPEVAVPLAERCAELGYTSMWANDHPAASGLETLADFAAGLRRRRARRRRARPRPPRAGRDQREDRRGRPRPRSPADRRRRGLLEEAADADARRARRAARGDPRRAPDPRRDGPEDVRAGGLALRRRLLQLDDRRLRRRRARARCEEGARAAGRDDAPRLRLRPHRRSAPTPRRAWPRRRASTATSTTATATTSSASASRRARSASRPSDPEDAAAAIDDYEDALDTIVVRGLASANLDAMERVASAAAPNP